MSFYDLISPCIVYPPPFLPLHPPLPLSPSSPLTLAPSPSPPSPLPLSLPLPSPSPPLNLPSPPSPPPLQKLPLTSSWQKGVEQLRNSPQTTGNAMMCRS